jgi:hypothetical protein
VIATNTGFWFLFRMEVFRDYEKAIRGTGFE